MDTLIQKLCIQIMKITIFEGDLTDISAAKEALHIRAQHIDLSKHNLDICYRIADKYSNNNVFRQGFES